MLSTRNSNHFLAKRPRKTLPQTKPPGFSDSCQSAHLLRRQRCLNKIRQILYSLLHTPDTFQQQRPHNMITPNNTRLLLSSRVSLLFTLLSKHTYLHSVMGSIGSCLWLINLALSLCGNVITQTHAHTSTSTCTVKRVPVEWNRGKWLPFISASRKIRFGSSKHTSHVNKRHLGFGWEKKMR